MDGVREIQTCKKVYFKEVLTNIPERVRRIGMWKNSSWILHPDNALEKNALPVKTFLTKHKITVLEYSPYSPDLAAMISLFPKMKSALKGARLEFIDTVKAKATEIMNKLKEDDLQHFFQKWKIQIEWCRDRGGEYIEIDNISLCNFFNKFVVNNSNSFIATPRMVIENCVL